MCGEYQLPTVGNTRASFNLRDDGVLHYGRGDRLIQFAQRDYRFTKESLVCGCGFNKLEETNDGNCFSRLSSFLLSVAVDTPVLGNDMQGIRHLLGSTYTNTSACFQIYVSAVCVCVCGGGAAPSQRINNNTDLYDRQYIDFDFERI